MAIDSIISIMFEDITNDLLLEVNSCIILIILFTDFLSNPENGSSKNIKRRHNNKFVGHEQGSLET